MKGKNTCDMCGYSSRNSHGWSVLNGFSYGQGGSKLALFPLAPTEGYDLCPTCSDKLRKQLGPKG